MKKTRIEVICKNCGIIFTKTPFELARGEGKYCSNKCRRVAKKTISKSEKWAACYERCQECGTIDIQHAARGFCKTCYNRALKANTLPIHNSPEKRCSDCNKPIRIVNMSGLCKSCYNKKYKSLHIENVKAVDQIWRNRNDSHLREWYAEFRSRIQFGNNDIKILKLYNFRCADCGMSNEKHQRRYSKRLHVHHRDGINFLSGLDVDNSLDNLEPLCVTCHRLKHIQNDIRQELRFQV